MNDWKVMVLKELLPYEENYKCLKRNKSLVGKRDKVALEGTGIRAEKTKSKL